MVKATTFYLKPTDRIPNSHFPLLYYPGLLSQGTDVNNASSAYDLFSDNGWNVQWIFRYGPTQQSHYHSRAHECMAVLTGRARIRFGAGDISEDLDENTHGSGWEVGGVEVDASAGDVFVIPAGVAHKTFDTTPAEFALLTPGEGKGVEAENPREALANLELSGFTMLGAYPTGSQWDFAVGDTSHEDWDSVWAVAKPDKDPALGNAQEGLCGLWEADKELKAE